MECFGLQQQSKKFSYLEDPEKRKEVIEMADGNDSDDYSEDSFPNEGDIRSQG